MSLSRFKWVPLIVVSLLFLQGANKGGCGDGLDNRAGEPGVDVGGAAGAEWDLTYSGSMEVVVKNGAALVATEQILRAVGGTFDVDGITVDLQQLCQRSDVACPDEVFPPRVTMTQPGNELHLLKVEFNKEGPLGELAETTLVGNVDSDFDFSIALGIGAAAAPPCGLLSVSYATGAIEHDGDDPPRGSSLAGEIVTAYTGGCLVSGDGGAVGGGLTVELRLPFTGTRR